MKVAIINLVFAIITLTLILIGTFLVGQQAMLANIFGTIFYSVGALLGLMLFTNRWHPF